jgi:DNA recombination-dependent growth factor C
MFWNLFLGKEVKLNNKQKKKRKRKKKERKQLREKMLQTFLQRFFLKGKHLFGQSELKLKQHAYIINKLRFLIIIIL